MTQVVLGFQDMEAFQKLRQELWSSWREHYTSAYLALPKPGVTEQIMVVETASEDLIVALHRSGGRVVKSPEEIEALLASYEGNQDAKVLRLQTWLVRKGFYKGFVDGSFGPATKAAVMAFQKASGLKPDGIVGIRTWEKLRRQTKEDGYFSD